MGNSSVPHLHHPSRLHQRRHADAPSPPHPGNKRLCRSSPQGRSHSLRRIQPIRSPPRLSKCTFRRCSMVYMVWFLPKHVFIRYFGTYKLRSRFTHTYTLHIHFYCYRHLHWVHGAMCMDVNHSSSSPKASHASPTPSSSSTSTPASPSIGCTLYKPSPAV